MRFSGPDGRVVHLAYCTNVHPGEDFDAVLAGLRAVSAPLRERVSPQRQLGIGLYLPQVVARELEARPARCDELRRELDRGGLYVATLNAFPYGGFHAQRVKEEVFRPTWADPERLEHTLVCARLLAQLAPEDVAPCLSTHTGGWRPWGRDGDFGTAVRAGLQAARRALGGLEREVLLALEPEPDSTQESVAELAAFLSGERRAAGEIAPERDLLAVCLDTCHAAVLFEDAARVEAELHGRARVAKLQLSSALELREPGRDGAARAELAAWGEPRWFHQVRGLRRDGELLACADLETLFAAPLDRAWLDCALWRVHFHVPIFVEAIGALGTTRAEMVALFRRALELDWTRVFEVETYTFDRLPPALRAGSGLGALVTSLARELEAARAVLSERGFRLL